MASEAVASEVEVPEAVAMEVPEAVATGVPEVDGSSTQAPTTVSRAIAGM